MAKPDQNVLGREDAQQRILSISGGGPMPNRPVADLGEMSFYTCILQL